MESGTFSERARSGDGDNMRLEQYYEEIKQYREIARNAENKAYELALEFLRVVNAELRGQKV